MKSLFLIGTLPRGLGTIMKKIILTSNVILQILFVAEKFPAYPEMSARKLQSPQYSFSRCQGET